MKRVLHIAAYDVADAKRLREALKVAKGYASGGQKSVFECFLAGAERNQFITEMMQAIDPREDRFLLLRLDPRSQIMTLGIAVAPEEPGLYYEG